VKMIYKIKERKNKVTNEKDSNNNI
jgi:hypothetical protein